MGKKMVRLHLVTIVVILVFAFLAIASSCVTPPPPEEVVTSSEETIESSVTQWEEGKVYHIPPPEEKSYETLGLVFATSVSKFDSEEKEISTQEGIVSMLLREAQKLGADDILNLRIDSNTTYTQTTTSDSVSTSTSSDSKSSVVTTKTITYTGSALAIKYLNEEE